MSICGSEVNAPDMGLTLSRYELPPLHLSVLEITNFLTRFLCRRIPRYRVEMFAQGFSNRLLDQLRQVVPISDDPSKETHIFSEISRNPSRQGPYRTSNLHYGEGKFKHFVGEKSDFENLKGFAYEVAVSVYDEYKQEFMTDTMIIEACNEYCLNVAEVLRKFPANMVIRCVEGTVYALFGPNENDEGMLGFQIYPRKDEDNNGDTRENSFGEQPSEDDTQSLLSDITFTKGEVEQISEHSTLSCEKLKREIQQCGRGFPEIPDDFIDIGTVTDDDARSRTSNMPPYRPKLGEDDPENDVYYMDLQLRKAPRYDYVKQKTVWVDEFFIAQRDPKFTAQTFSGTRFGSVKLKSHPYYSQYSDRGAGFYHFTMPSILPSLRLMAAGATCSTMMNELYSKPIPDEEAEKMKEEERDDEKKGDEKDEEEEEEGNIKRCDDQDYSD